MEKKMKDLFLGFFIFKGWGGGKLIKEIDRE